MDGKGEVMEKTIILKKSDVEGLLTMDDCLKAVENAFVQDALGRVQMPPKMYLFFRKHDGDLRVMPSYLEELEMAGVKCVNVHPSNPREHSLPTVMAVIELVDPRTGFPLALMDGTYITDMRTGAAGGGLREVPCRSGGINTGDGGCRETGLDTAHGHQQGR